MTAGRAVNAPRPEDFLAIRQYIERELGIQMPASKVPMLQSRLQRRIATLGLSSYHAYHEYLFRSPDAKNELVSFIDAVTTNKTDFWREPAHFDYLVRHALPSLERARGGATTWKVWSAGCSSGEEPYTLAMVLADYCRERPGSDFALLGTDISTRVLAHAKMAIYDADRTVPLPSHLSKRYVLRSRDPAKRQVRIVPELRKRITFRRLNFMDHDYGVTDMFDAIFFRNVAIYFDAPTQTKVVTRLCKNLRPGGYFFTGCSESLVRASVPLKQLAPATYVRI